MRRAVAALAALALAGCVTREESSFRIASAFCARLRTCDRAAFDEAFATPARCRSAQQRSFQNVDAAARGRACSYDGTVVFACVDALPSTPCETFEPSQALAVCLDAWRCDDGPAVALEAADVVGN